ncbi:MAG TPA: bifunctional adenosylcobinamide kinase/adenosylcobinamide-phosphate guanylyltransferase [Solirubrobacteraceae bacterium]|nr:bifunctional adenosylcobinamide kinase/adenosylcobinamide-phosphate guanylyltransferase [Solirubrobacteraceae bacterium]
MSLVVLIGGARSGKSSLAVRLAAGSGAPVVFIATGEGRDAEMAGRIARHRAERPTGWDTVEEPVDLHAAVESAPPAACVVVDCLSLWVANLLEQGSDPDLRVPLRNGPMIAVSNEVGLGVVPATPLGRAYRDVLGRVNAAWAAAADEAYFVVAGKALRLHDV